MFDAVKGRGFALVEMVVVVAILVILAAFAVPRFTPSDVETRSAATTALGANLRTRVARSHALWLAEGQPDTVTLDGRAVVMTNGYPDETAVDATLESLEGFVHDDSSSPAVFLKTNESSKPIANCGVRYRAAPARGAAPGIEVDTSGC
jgi:MSHA pilin protein MshA